MMVILAFNELRILKAIPLESQKPLNLPGISIYIYHQIPNQKKKAEKTKKNSVFGHFSRSVSTFS